jgi:phosphoglycolate phosphatase
MPAFRSVIFDFDGTLADSREDVWCSIAAAAEALSIEVPDEFRRCPENLALSQREIFNVLCPHGGEDTLRYFQLFLHDHYLYKNTFANTTLYPGIEDMLNRFLTEDWALFIVSMKQFSALDKLLKLKKWDRYFKKWLSSDGPGCWTEPKTKTELIGLIIRDDLNFAPVVYVGDSWGDIRAAHENNIPAVGVLYGDGDQNLLRRENPEFCVTDSAVLGGLLLSLAADQAPLRH